MKDKSPPTVTFIENKATINLYLEKKKASRFDFLIGFLPNNNNEDNTNEDNINTSINDKNRDTKKQDFILQKQQCFSRLPVKRKVENQMNTPRIVNYKFEN